MNKELTIQRTIKAPVDKVWEAWTDPAAIAQWWGPRGVTNPTSIWEPEVGGQINITMLAGPELGPMSGQQWPMDGKFTAVDPKSRLVFNSRALMDGQPILETTSELTLEADGSNTHLTLKVKVTNATEAAAGPIDGMNEGWNQSLDKLTELVEGER